MAIRWMIALVDPPIAALVRIAFSNAARVMMCSGRRSSSTSRRSAGRPRCAISMRRESTAGQVADPAAACRAPRPCRPSSRRCPSSCSARCERAMQPSATTPSSAVIRPALISASNFHTWVPEPTSLALELAVEHRAAGDHHRREVDAGRGHQQPRSGLVAAGQQHHAVQRVGPDQLLGLHGQQVAVQHRGRAASASRRCAMTGNTSGNPPACQTPRLTASATRSQVDVARRQFRPGGRDADDRAAVEDLRAEALVAHPGPVEHAGRPVAPNHWLLRSAPSEVMLFAVIQPLVTVAPAGHAPGPFGINAVEGCLREPCA